LPHDVANAGQARTRWESPRRDARVTEPVNARARCYR